ncbi:D-2-hydroxyacid dehydrogenase [Treponema sp.]
MKAKGKILLVLAENRIPHKALERIQEAADGREVMIRTSKDGLESILDDVEIVAGDFPPSLVEKTPNLSWFQLWYAGADWVQKFPIVKELPLSITTASGIHGEQMTEHLFGLLFAWNRQFPKAFAAQERSQWLSFQHSDMDTLQGKTMVILGYGAIGKKIARAAEVFGMKVIGVRRNPSQEGTEASSSSVQTVSFSDLGRVLPLSDVLVNILPLTAETRGMFGEQQFKQMKETALFVNIGRGGTVDQDAMIAALKEKRIKAALLDVCDPEPLPASSPLWKMQNVLLSSHYSGFHPNYDKLALGVFLDNLNQYVRGEKLLNEVNKSLGY